MTFATDHPLTSFAETLHGAKVASDLLVQQPHGKVIGIVSALPAKENLSWRRISHRIVASLGASTILIDADLRHPGLSNAVAPSTAGLFDAIMEGLPVSELLYHEEQTGLSILPAGNRRPYERTADLEGHAKSP
jgi:polysaccharide biosynthesis transport protein